MELDNIAENNECIADKIVERIRSDELEEKIPRTDFRTRTYVF